MVLVGIARFLVVATAVALTGAVSDTGGALALGPGDYARPSATGPGAAAGGGVLHLVQGVTAPKPVDPPAERPVSYSEQQSTYGRKAYRKYCRLCHGGDLNDGEFGGPPLRGVRFKETFGGQSVAALYDYISVAMPPDKPGQLSKKSLIGIVAYILDRNGYPAGAPMPRDADLLEYLIVEK